MSLMDKASSGVQLMTRHNDIAMVALLVIVITLMIVPLPTPLVDTLIGMNMTLSFLMLMMAMYIKTALDFSAFPTMLLFTTLFRVGLNITTTRLILLQADAGEIIFTFGDFALGGNFVVGAVVFLILTIVQFLVIAKGAERVAEVGARFTLDAMPGKQMSIDADMRAGVIDMEEAQNRRNRVQLESQMYGAMDGAMKFVKGDSIAGMIIAVVNIVGGTIIGVTQNGMTAAEALHTYGILTIGDGLVSQIPSLLVSISAGILITRSGDSGGNVGAQVGQQFFSQPKALQMAGALIFLFALIPVAVGIVPLLLLRWRINVLTLGDDECRTMGVNASRLRVAVILFATLITAASVSVSGTIGWIGLVIPHFSRRLVGNNYRKLLPVSMLFGAVFLLLVDDISRNLFTTEIPIGILTSVIGVPFFLYLISGEGDRL